MSIKAQKLPWFIQVVCSYVGGAQHTHTAFQKENKKGNAKMYLPYHSRVTPSSLVILLTALSAALPSPSPSPSPAAVPDAQARVSTSTTTEEGKRLVEKLLNTDFTPPPG